MAASTKERAAKNGASQEDAPEPVAEPSVPVPGGVSTEELATLYSAAKIELRAANEQLAERDKLLASWGQLGTKLMMLLGAEEIDAILPAVEKLTVNRQARRAAPKSRKKKGG